MAQDPWANDPIVNLRDAPPVADAPRPYKVVRRTSTSETPTQLLNQGYRQEADGTWAKVVGTEPMPWEADPVVTDSQLAAADRADTIVGDTNTDARENALLQGVTFGFADELGGNFAGWGQQLRNIGRNLNGQPIEIRGADLRDAVIEQTRGRNADFRETNPIQSGAFELAGGLLTGGGSVGAGVRGLAATGALYGGAYGAGTGEGGIVDRLPGAAIGAGTGAAGGAALGVAMPYAQRLGSIAGGLVPQPVREFVGRIGASRPAPEVVAARRLSSVITPEALAERTRLQGLGLNPSVLDTLDNTGERMIRSAAGPAGPGADAAVTYSRNRAADLKPEIMGVTRGLSPDPRSATAVREGLEAQRSTLAEQDYRPAYQTPVNLTDEVVSAISDEPGRAALRRARQAAVARRDTQQVAEIDALLAGDPNPEIPVFHGSPVEGLVRLEPRSAPDEFGFPGVVSVSTDRNFASRWAGEGGQVYEGALSTQGLGDFRRDGDAQKVIDFYRRQGTPLDANDIEAVGRGEWRLWENKDLWRENGWRGSFVRESGGPDALNVSLADGSPVSLGRAPRPSQPFPQSVSAGTLDRTRIALSNRAEALGRNATGARDVAGGLRSRAGDIDAALEGVEALAPARATYRDLSGAMEQIDNASGIFNTDPADFARQVQGMSPTQREAAIIGLRQEILDTLGGQRAAGTGSLQNLSESTYARQNLATLLGPEEAAQFIGRIEAGVQQAQRAARISPNTNSQTFGRGIDDETFNTANMIGATVDVGQSLTGNVMAMGRTIDRIASRATLSPQERAAIVELGIGSADELERIVRIAQESRQRGRPPPREVRAWIANAQNVLGPRNPIAQQLEQALLPTRVAASEDQQGQGR